MSTKRVITVISTKGGRIEKFTTNVSTWGDLKMLIQDNYDLNNLKAVENINKTTLEHIDAALPEGDFRLFLRPSKTKSGIDMSQASFKEMRGMIKEDPGLKEALNSFAKDSGRNWTQLRTEEMRNICEEYFSSPGIEEVTETTSTSQNLDLESLNPSAKVKLAKKLLNSAEKDLNDDEFEVGFEFERAVIFIEEIFEEIERYYENENIFLEECTSKTTEVDLERVDIERELRDLEDGFM